MMKITMAASVTRSLSRNPARFQKTKKWVLISGSTGDARQQAAPIAKPQGKAKAGTKKTSQENR